MANKCEVCRDTFNDDTAPRSTHEPHLCVVCAADLGWGLDGDGDAEDVYL